MTRSYKLFIIDIIESIEKIERYIDGLSYETFKGNGLVVDAVVRNLEIIGEASRNVPDSITEQHPNISWHKMIGLRNLLTHEYFGVNKKLCGKLLLSICRKKNRCWKV